MRTLALLVVLALVGCSATNDDQGPDAGEVDASVDALSVPLCSDVGCPDIGFCRVDGCCTCNATGEPVMCRTEDAEPDACDGAGATKSAPPTSDQCDAGLWCPPSTPDAAWE